MARGGVQAVMIVARSRSGIHKLLPAWLHTIYPYWLVRVMAAIQQLANLYLQQAGSDLSRQARK
jgi:hypothetical protein